MDTPVAHFVEVLLHSGVLDPAQQEEFLREGPRHAADLRVLTDELLRRGWLTRFQLAALASGRGQGLVCGRYLLLEGLGEGGMGRVYKARHRRMRRVVALKFIREDLLADPSAVRRFYREIEAAARLSHPNIVMAFEADEVNGMHFFATEYVEGVDLRTLIATHGALPAALACEVTRQAALGLHHAHLRGVVHRDIKPANLLLSREGVVKILDLGLARLIAPDPDGPRTGRLTRTGEVLGTPDYLAPEQIDDFRRADTRTDIYGLGCTLYHLLAGATPFAGRSLAEKLLAHRRGESPDLATLRSDLPPGLSTVVRVMMAVRPEDRYQSPAEVASALEPFSRPVHVVQSAAPLALPSETGPIWEGSGSPNAPGRHETLAMWPGASSPAAATEPEPLAPAHRPPTWRQVRGLRKRRALVAAALVLVPLGLSVWGLWAIRETGQGTLIVQVMEPDVEVSVGERMIPIGPDKVGRLGLGPGEHTLRITRGGDMLFARSFTLRSGGREVITARWESRNPGTPGPVVESRAGPVRVASPRGAPGRRVPEGGAVQADPGSARDYLDRGRAHAAARDPARALADASEAIRLDPTLAEAYTLRATAYNMSSQESRAIADATAALRLDPGSSAAYAQRALAHNNVGAHDRAIADATAALRLDPRSSLAYTQRAWAYLMAKGDPDRAIADYTEALRLDPRAAWVYEHRARAYIKKGDPDRVIADCTAALRFDPKLAFAHFERGEAYARKGDYLRALADADEAIRLEPQLAEAHRLRGDVSAEEWDLERAIASYTEAIRLDPKSVASYRGRAEAHLRKGEADRAAVDRREAERLESPASR